MSIDPFVDKSYIKEKTEYAFVFDPNQNMNDLYCREVPEPAKQFEFELDTFQKQAVLCLENHRNVLVAAHTSAGKTVVADYAIAMAFQSSSRVIYTSPIKALSNQKYRDFKQEFSDVGLLTGDVQIDTEAKCLIMTTEILLQMLYNKSEIINDLEWVIFDECHYVNDKERGHVWEEVFILLPETCNLVLLSATVPNVVQFADWLGRARKRPTYVVSTSKRPVPLQHYLYLGKDTKSKDERFMIVDSTGKFFNDKYLKAEEIIQERKGKLGYIKRSPQMDLNVYKTLIRHLQETDGLPVICFTLSRNRCDSNLESLMSISEETLRLTTKEEENHIHHFIWRHLNRLKKCDQQLPQIQTSISMLKRGFGVHHSGILPILKELTEILFSDGYVKVLVATETFAMGVNMPARTVVFDSIDKHDGTEWRDLKPSEYIQMAGRAGRRGKDKTGTVIILCKYDIPDSPRLTSMMQGAATELVSQFRLTYNMICNLHKTRGSEEEIEKFLEQSFGEHHRLKETSNLNNQLMAVNSHYDSLPALECGNCTDIDIFYKCFESYLSTANHIMPVICQRALDKSKLKSGTIVAIVGIDNPFESAVVLRINKEKNSQIHSLTVLLAKENNQFEYKDIGVNCIHKILNKQLAKKFDSKTIIEENEKKNIKHKDQTIDAIEKLKQLDLENNYTILSSPSIDPKTLIKEIDLVPTLNQFISLGQQLPDFECVKCKDFVPHFKEMEKRALVKSKSTDLEYQLSNQSLQLYSDYKCRVNLLKFMDYMDEERVLKMKGKIACLISEHELVITEMLMDNVIGNMEPEEIAALLSAFVFQQSKANRILNPNINEVLKKKRLEVEELEKMVEDVERQCSVPQSMVNPVLNFDLLEVVYEWAKGKPFIEVLQLTETQDGLKESIDFEINESINNELQNHERQRNDRHKHEKVKREGKERAFEKSKQKGLQETFKKALEIGKERGVEEQKKSGVRIQEGIIVRCIQRLDELMKFIKLSAKEMGNKELEDRIELASQVIRRDIVFCQSLYTISDDSSNDKENEIDESLSSNFV